MKTTEFTRKNIKNGKTLYEVMAYPLKQSATVQTIRVTSRLKAMSISGNARAFVYFECLSNGTDALPPLAGLTGELPSIRTPGTPEKALRMANDRNLFKATSKNHHRLFTSQRKAKAYADLVRSGCHVGSMFDRKASTLEQIATR